MLFGLQGEGIDVDTRSRDVGVVLVGLDKVEVRTKALRETIVTVKLELGANNGVATSVAGAEARVVGTVGSIGEGGEVGGGDGVGTRATSGGEVESTKGEDTVAVGGSVGGGGAESLGVSADVDAGEG